MYGGPVCGMLYADDAGVLCESTENLAEMTVIVTVFKSADLTVCEKHVEVTLLRTLCKVLLAPPFVIEAAGQRYILQTMHFLCLGAVLSTIAPTLCH